MVPSLQVTFRAPAVQYDTGTARNHYALFVTQRRKGNINQKRSRSSEGISRTRCALGVHLSRFMRGACPKLEA